MDHLNVVGLSADLLLDTLPWGVLVLGGAEATVHALNQQGAVWWGLPAAAVLGQPLAALAPAHLPASLYQALQALAAGATLPPADFFLPASGQWITQTSARQGGQVVVYWQDITARRQVEIAALAGSEEKYRALFNTADEGFAIIELVVNADGRPVDFIYQETNPAFVKHVGKDWQGRRRSEVLPERLEFLLEKYAAVVATGEPLHLEYEVRSLANQWFQLTVSRIGGADSRHLGVIFRNSSQRKRREAHLAFLADINVEVAPLLSAEQIMGRVREQLAAYLHLSRLHLAAVDPTADHLDFLYDWQRAAGHQPQLGAHRLADSITAAGRQHFGAGRPLVATGQQPSPLLAAQPGVLAGLAEGAFVAIPHLLGSHWRFMLIAARAQPGDWRPDEVELLQQVGARIWARLERAQAEAALQKSEEQFRLFVTASSDMLYRMSPDWRKLLVLEGKGFLANTLTPSTTWVERYLPPADQAQTWAAIEASVAGRLPFELEHRVYRADGAVAWVASRAVPVLDAQGQLLEWFGTATDITARREAQQQMAEFNAQLEQQVAERTRQLQENRDLLRSVFDTSLLSMSVLHAVRDEAGRVQDFRIGLVNRELERETGRTDLVGKLYVQQYPGVRLTGLYDLMLRTLATGRPQGMEYFYEHEGFNQWFACQFVRMGDALVATNLDITERKTAEQERIKNLRLLEQAEAVAGLGSWDYELATGAMRWSDGMYQLLGLPLGQPVTPAIYLDHVVAADRPRAEQLVRQLTAGTTDVEDTLHLRVGSQVKIVRLRAVVLHDEQGQPARVLGVDLDISELHRLEQENLRLRLSQQQALFEAVQAAQEAERRRIAEGLHNGIGQILYATKLRLDQLSPLAEAAPTAWQPAHREANRLLGEAIRQARTLSHELVPLVLEEFGLAAALQDICDKLSSPQLPLHCQVQLDAEAPPLAAALQLALYRMAQELGQNIVKHALGATEASLELETIPGAVLLRAEDNGPGFAAPLAASTGLGLRSIRDQVALLGGAMQVGPHPGAGAYVRIRLPLHPA